MQELESEKVALQNKLGEAEHAVSLSFIDKESSGADKSQIESEKAAVEERLRAALGEASAARYEITRFTKQLSEAKSKYGLLISKNEVSASDLAKIKQKKAEIEGRLRDSEVQLDLLRHDLLSSGIRLEESETSKRAIENLLNEAKHTNTQLEAQLMTADSDIFALQRSRNAYGAPCLETNYCRSLRSACKLSTN
jgi:chromosome segregation ATPase